MNDKLLDVESAATFLNITKSALKAYLRNGKLKNLQQINIGRRIFFQKSDLQKILMEQNIIFDPTLLTVEEAAIFLGIKVETLYTRGHRRKYKDLRPVKIENVIHSHGNRVYYKIQDLRKILNEQIIHDDKTYVKNSKTGEWVVVQKEI